MTTTTRSSAQDYGKAATEAVDEVLEGARSVRESAAGMASEAKAAAGPVFDTVREQAHHLGEQAQDMAGNAYEHGRSAVRAVNRQLEEQPLFTALAAFAIGYGISYLLHGQR